MEAFTNPSQQGLLLVGTLFTVVQLNGTQQYLLLHPSTYLPLFVYPLGQPPSMQVPPNLVSQEDKAAVGIGVGIGVD